MSFDVESSLDTVKAALEGMDPQRFAAVRIGNPPQSVLPAGYTAVVTMDSARVVELSLSTAIELHTARVRIYRAMAAAPDEEDAKQRYRIVPEVMDLLKGDFSLGGSVRAIDWGGIYGQTPEVEYSNEDIATKEYWTAHLVLPLIVHPDAVFVS